MNNSARPEDVHSISQCIEARRVEIGAGHPAAAAGSFATSALHFGHFKYSPLFWEYLETIYGEPQVSHFTSTGLSQEAKSQFGYRVQP
jgi:hypothetical protein